MKKILILMMFSTNVWATDTMHVTTSTGSYLINSSGSTTYITTTSGGTSTGNNIGVAVPVNVNPVTGIGMIHGPNGSSAVIRSTTGSVSVIPLSGGRK